ncbi:hypothetical protein D3C72_2210360 [compost metagenome]
MRDRARLLQPLVLRLRLYLEEPEHPVLLELIAKAGKIEAAHEIFDIEGGKSKGHQAIP